jgi:hypothetical protein
MEPILKALLCLLGVFIELFIGNRGWRPLYKADGHFAEFHANNWQVGPCSKPFWQHVQQQQRMFVHRQLKAM